METWIVVAIAATVVVALYCRMRFIAGITIFDFQKGLLYRSGSFVKLLDAGRYRYLKSRSVIQIVDTRKKLISLSGQDILTKDNVNVKISLAGFYQIADPVKANRQSQNYADELYNIAQMALRNIAGSFTLDALLEKKSEMDAMLLATVAPKAEELGLSVSTIAMKDIMLPANLKKAYSGVLEAQKEAQRQLEKARGEQAVLRSLANASVLYESNPMLLQARIIQALSVGNNTIVFGADDKLTINEKPKS
jgi:regulator of protease activity HflC (stomatin/prohibitin superfamily)